MRGMRRNILMEQFIELMNYGHGFLSSKLALNELDN